MNWKEDWQTTVVGVLIIVAVGYRFYKTGEIDWPGTVAILAGIGFLRTRDTK